jgi:two-component system, OmpR family, phosphate regulon sensor histidine kinase PhoR
VFDKEETDPDKEGGLGLGLAIVKTFVEAHDRVVNVESRLGVGSTFRFTLPARRSSDVGVNDAIGTSLERSS